MSRHVLSLAVALVLSHSLYADIVCESRVYGEKFAIRATDKEVQAAPKWGKAADNPPLSARGAIDLEDLLARLAAEHGRTGSPG